MTLASPHTTPSGPDGRPNACDDFGAAGQSVPTASRIAIDLGERSYDVVIGPSVLASCGGELARRCTASRMLVITDETVAGLHLPSLQAVASAQGLTVEAMIVPVGEGAKSWAQLEGVVDFLLARDIERGEPIWALGGGVVGDLAGFAAAITKRGVPFVQIPTTLLAQVDSSVGGKTAINAAAGKNLIGAFHQPELVMADTSVLGTLPDEEIRAGLAEIIKIAAVRDGAFFAWLEDNMDAVRAGDPAARSEAIGRSVALKAQIVAEDEREGGVRALLNLGHTFGHAIEAEAKGGVIHGLAVGVGSVLASDYAVETGVCAPETRDRIVALIAKAGLPTHMAALAGAPFDADRLLARMGNDKKVEAGAIRLVLPSAIGEGKIIPVGDITHLRKFLAAACAVTEPNAPCHPS